jgi:hypothetical protein
MRTGAKAVLGVLKKEGMRGGKTIMEGLLRDEVMKITAERVMVMMEVMATDKPI